MKIYMIWPITQGDHKQTGTYQNLKTHFQKIWSSDFSPKAY